MLPAASHSLLLALLPARHPGLYRASLQHIAQLASCPTSPSCLSPCSSSSSSALAQHQPCSHHRSMPAVSVSSAMRMVTTDSLASTVMDRLKPKLLELLAAGQERLAVDMFRRVMQEGMQAGGGRELPAEYRPDGVMLDEYFRALSRLHRMTDMQLGDGKPEEQQAGLPGRSARPGETAQQCVADIEEALVWSKAAGHKAGPSVYSELLRAFWRAGKPECMEPVISEMMAAGHTPNLSTFLTLVMANLEAGNLTKGWSMLEAMLLQQHQEATTTTPSTPTGSKGLWPDPLLCRAASLLLQTAASSRQYELAQSVQKRLVELGVAAEVSAAEACMVACMVAAAQRKRTMDNFSNAD